MARQLYICNVKNPSEHCKTHCFHGVPHFKERDMDANCEKNSELCDCSNAKRKVRVSCRKLTKRELR